MYFVFEIIVQMIDNYNGLWTVGQNVYEQVIVNENGDSVINGELAPGAYCIIVTDGNGCVSGSGSRMI